MAVSGHKQTLSIISGEWLLPGAIPSGHYTVCNGTNKKVLEIPWPHILAEGVVIVASILLALAADAWWDAPLQSGDGRAGRDDQLGKDRLPSARYAPDSSHSPGDRLSGWY
jgi:hypothetical protein